MQLIDWTDRDENILVLTSKQNKTMNCLPGDQLFLLAPDPLFHIVLSSC